MVTFSHFEHPALSAPMPYLLTRPDGTEGKKLPLVVFLHGAGERGDDREKLMVHGVPRYFGENPSHLGLEAITLSPQCPLEATWCEFPTVLMALIRQIAECEGADYQRISITGISMGGYGTWEMLCRYPDFFSAAAPICGGGMTWRIFTKTPVRAFHGDADPTVPVTYSILMVDALNAHGGQAELVLYHGCAHDSWTRTYEKTDVLSWLVHAERR